MWNICKTLPCTVIGSFWFKCGVEEALATHKAFDCVGACMCARMQLFGECGFVHVNQLQFLLWCVALHMCVCVCGNCSLEFAWVCVHMCMLMKSVAQRPSSLSGEALTSVMLCQRSKQTRAERWAQTFRGGLLARIDAHTHQPVGTYCT